MRTLILVVVVAVLGCEPAPEDTGDQASAYAGARCGLVAGATYTTKWTHQHMVSAAGDCSMVGTLPNVVVTDIGDPCGAIGQHLPASICGAPFSVGCYTSGGCDVYAAIACSDICQGQYTIAFTRQ